MVVGGIPLNFNQNFKLGEGPEFVIEGRRIQHVLLRQGAEVPPLRREHADLNNIEFDHADIYANLEAIIDAFRKGVQRVAPGGTIVANGEDANVCRSLRSARRRAGSLSARHAAATRSPRTRILAEDRPPLPRDGKGGVVPLSHQPSGGTTSPRPQVCRARAFK